MPGNLREDEIGQVHASRKRRHENCDAVQHMEKSLENGLTVAIKENLGQTVRKVWLVHDPTEREEVAGRNKGEVRMPSSSNFREKRPAPDKKNPLRVEKFKNTGNLKSQHCSNGTSSGASEPSHVTMEPSSSRQQNKNSSGTSEPFHVTTDPSS